MRFVKIKMRYTGTLFTPLLRYKGSAKISDVIEYNPNFPIQLVATGTILKILIIMKKKKRSCYCRKELEVQVAHRVKQEPILIQQSQVWFLLAAEIFSIIHKFQLCTAFHYHPDIHGPETGFPLHFENGLHFVLFLYFCTPYVLDHMGNVIILGVLQCKMP